MIHPSIVCNTSSALCFFLAAVSSSFSPVNRSNFRNADYLPRSMSLGIFSEDEAQAYIAYKQNMGRLADFVPEHEVLKLTGHVPHSLAFF